MKEAMNVRLVLYFFISILTLPSPAFCTPIQWTSGAGANGHYYEWVSYTGNWTNLFENASPFATGEGIIDLTSSDGTLTNGYLATVTSAEENAFILSQFFTVSESLAFLGGRDSNYNNPSHTPPPAIWSWETGPEIGQTFFMNHQERLTLNIVIGHPGSQTGRTSTIWPCRSAAEDGMTQIMVVILVDLWLCLAILPNMPHPFRSRPLSCFWESV